MLPLEVCLRLVIVENLERPRVVKDRAGASPALRVVVIEGVELVEEERLNGACVCVADLEALCREYGDSHHFLLCSAASATGLDKVL